MLKDYFVIAFRNIKHRGLRSWLTMLGIFISIATIFILISLSLGLQEAVQEQFRQLGTDKFFLQPATGFLGPPGSVGGVILTEKDLDVINKVRGVKDYSFFVAGNAKIEYKDKIRYLYVWGVPADRLDLFTESTSLEIEEGRLIRKNENGIILGNFYKQGKVFGKEVMVGDDLNINGQNVNVKGIWEIIGNPDDDQSIMMELNLFRELFDIPDRVDYIMIQVQEGEDVNEVAERTEKRLRKTRDVTEKTQDFSILTPEELLRSFGDILNIITAFLGGIAAISLIVGGIGIANTMYTSVIERTKEIGVMKAIGAKNKDIMILFIIESGLLGLVGGFIGVGLGIAIGKIVEYIAITQLNTNLLTASTPIWLMISCIAFGFLIGIVSGALPSWQASKTKVVDALRYE